VNAPWTAPAYLLEAVRSRGFSAQFLDYNIRLYHGNFSPELWTENLYHQFWVTQPLEYFVDQIDLREINARVVGFSLTETNLRFSIALARRIRQRDPNKIILFGGHRVFFEEEPGDQVPPDACDAIVRGEGELTLLDILQNGLNKNAGTYTPENGRWVFNGERELIADLDRFPWPRYEDVRWPDYLENTLNIMSSRGCINRCAFCNDIVRAEHRYRHRSAGHIAEEMFYHKAKNGVGFFVFNDPLINGHYPTLDGLCEILLQRNLNRSWAGNFAIRGNMPVELIRKAKRAGLETAILGLESGSRHALELMKKRFTIEEAEWFIDALHESGIKIDLNLIVGFPGETEEDFQETLALLAKIAHKVTQVVSVATLNLDHSYLWDHLEEYDVVKLDKDRHISWYTRDGTNTYAVRLDRADRLLRHVHDLGLSHMRFDADIERKDALIGLDQVRRRRETILFKREVKQLLRTVKHLNPMPCAKQGVRTIKARLR
jgi:radical SAM superfamily enzyme YgiQ (UPF0313 family)